MSTTYKVIVTDTFPAEIDANGRHRAGIFVDRVHGYEGPLTEAQLAAVEADSYLRVERATEEASEETSTPATPKKPVKK